MSIDIERALFQEKVSRDDTTGYCGNLLIRQRLINQAVVQFGERLLPRGSRVIDACAGPEGSLLASSLKGYKWIGNDICVRFGETLSRTGAEVVLSDFAAAPFRDGVADGVFFIFALHNISNPKSALSEAARVTNNNGVVLVADPGISIWESKIILHWLLSKQLNQADLNAMGLKEIANFFAAKPYTEEDYSDFFTQRCLGKAREELLPIALSVMETKVKRDKVYHFCNKLAQINYVFFEQSVLDAGFKLAKAGILAMVQFAQQTSWEVFGPIEVSENTWLQNLMEIRKWNRATNPFIGRFPETWDHAAKRIVLPIWCFKK